MKYLFNAERIILKKQADYPEFQDKYQKIQEQNQKQYIDRWKKESDKTFPIYFIMAPNYYKLVAISMNYAKAYYKKIIEQNLYVTNHLFPNHESFLEIMRRFGFTSEECNNLSQCIEKIAPKIINQSMDYKFKLKDSLLTKFEKQNIKDKIERYQDLFSENILKVCPHLQNIIYYFSQMTYENEKYTSNTNLLLNTTLLNKVVEIIYFHPSLLEKENHKVLKKD